MPERHWKLSWPVAALSIGQSFSSLGDFLFYVALMVAIYEQTGSALAVGYLTVIETAPRLVLAPVAGVWIDRSNPKRTMIASDLLRCVTVLFLLVNHSTLSIYVVSALLASLGIFFAPARGAFMPRVFQGDMLLHANATISTCGTFMRIVGPAIGAVLTAKAGMAPAVWANAASFVVSALFISTVPFNYRVAQEQPEHTTPRSRSWAMLRDGVKYIANNPIVVVIMGVGGLSAGAITATSTLLMPYATEQIGVGSSVMGYLTSAEGIGAILAGASIGLLSRRIRSGTLIGLGYGLVAIAIVGLAAARNIPLALLAIGLAGAGMVASSVAEETVVQLVVSGNMLARVFSLIVTAYTVIQLIAAPLAGFLADQLGVPSVFLACGAVLLLAAVVAWLRLGRNHAGDWEGVKDAASQG